MAASCESSRPVSCFSNASSFFASSRVPSNVSRILTKARMTRLRRGFGVAGKNVDSRSPETLGAPRQ